MRAGKLKIGEDAVLQAVRSQNAKLVIVANDASQATSKKIQDKCLFYGVSLRKYGFRDEIGACIGKDSRVLIACIDEGFAKAMIKLLDIENEVDSIEERKR
jgi:ribosomal protein L7Ae-like RNA K-turn-binding protein